ncbi:MAG: CHAT domain-containing protein [Planctomycetota bacterium]
MLAAHYPKGTGVLLYAYVEKSLQVWVIRAGGIAAYHRGPLSLDALEAAAASLRAALRVDAAAAARAPRLRVRTGRGLSRRKPACSILSVEEAVRQVQGMVPPGRVPQGLRDVRHVAVVPVLGLGSLPFALFQPFPDEGPLIEHMSVSVAPSLQDLAQPVQPWTWEVRSPLVVGNPKYARHRRWELPALPGAEREARDVARGLDVEALTGKRAVEAVVSRAARDADLLYFATHAAADPSDPLDGSFLALAPGRGTDGWWTAREIQGIRIGDAKLAVLSACQTGLGRVHEAGVIGIARAFQIAGAPRVVMSLWSVSDAATDALMTEFSKHLEDEIPSEALRKGMLALRERDADPAHWAAFTLFGTPR